jgi:glycosyltransferase involved in cell wall biosynthesis
MFDRDNVPKLLASDRPQVAVAHRPKPFGDWPSLRGFINGDYPFVTVVMPVRNEAGFIERSLGAVVHQDYPWERMEVIVADGMSTDGTREILREFQQRYPNVRVIDNPGRIVPTGLNAAIAEAKGEIIVRVDGHCEIAPDYVRRCVAHLRREGVEGVGGPLENVGLTRVAAAIAAGMGSRFGVGNSHFRIGSHRPRIVDTVPFPAYKREIIERAGPFDEELVRNQDDEYNYRLRKLGARILLAPDVRSKYYSRSSLLSLWGQYFEYGFWKVRVLQKHPKQMQLRQFVPPLFVLSLLCSGVASFWLKPAALILAGIAGSYAVANFSVSLLVARRAGWRNLPLLPLVFATLHLSYGSGFLLGLCRFWNRWGKAAAAGSSEKSPGRGPTGQREEPDERRYDNASSRR